MEAEGASRIEGGKNSKGAILIVILWVLLAMSMLALSFSAAIRTEVDAARNTVDQKQSYYLARAGIEYAKYKILESQSGLFRSQQLDFEEGPVPAVLRGKVSLDLSGGGADVEIIDETGKINVNLAPPHLIFNLLVMVGIPEAEADIITDSIEDWRDPDDFRRPHGAESEYYQTLPDPYSAKNGPLDVPEELLLVRGVTPEFYYGRRGLNAAGERVEYYGLQKHFTTFSAINRINVNSAPVPVLAAIPGLEYEAALEIVRMREGSPIDDVGEIMSRIPGIPADALSYLSVMRSNVYTLESYGRLNDSRVVSRIRCVVRLLGTRGGAAVLYWNESNIEL